jgi:hypothetical protein
MIGADGFMLVYKYFHLESLGIRVLLLFTALLIWVWRRLVRSLVVLWKITALQFCQHSVEVIDFGT